MASRRYTVPNPFDSDDEDQHQKNGYNPFDKKPTKFSNPFDDNEESGFSRASLKNPSNPFSDDDYLHSSTKPRNDLKNFPKKSTQKGAFDDEFNGGISKKNDDDFKNSNMGSVNASNSRRGSHLISRFSATVGESAMKTAEKIKESGQKIRIRRTPSPPEITLESNNLGNGISEKKRTNSVDERNLLIFSENSESSSRTSYGDRRRYVNDFRDSGGFDNQSVEELQGYAVYKAEETTKTTDNCLRIAENIREDASQTLLNLHRQGEQIAKTHNITVDIDQDLSRGEKLLGNLGGIFSKTWKPEKTRPINGPLITPAEPSQRRAKHREQREELGLIRTANGRSDRNYNLSEDAPQARIQLEKTKQDDALSDLSNVLDELKEMALDMGSEMQRQSTALDHFSDDVTELNHRVKGASLRGRRLLGK